MKINQERLARVLSQYGLDPEKLAVNIDNYTRLDDLQELIAADVKPETIYKLWGLRSENYEVAFSYMVEMPNKNYDWLLDDKIPTSKLDGFFRIAKDSYEAEFGRQKDRGKVFMTRDELCRLSSFHEIVSEKKLPVLHAALQEGLDYQILINQSSTLTDQEFHKSLVTLRNNKAEVFKLLNDNGHKSSEIMPQVLHKLLTEYNNSSSSFDIDKALNKVNYELNIEIHNSLFNCIKLSSHKSGDIRQTKVNFTYKDEAHSYEFNALLTQSTEKFIFNDKFSEIEKAYILTQLKLDSRLDAVRLTPELINEYINDKKSLTDFVINNNQFSNPKKIASKEFRDQSLNNEVTTQVLDLKSISTQNQAVINVEDNSIQRRHDVTDVKSSELVTNNLTLENSDFMTEHRSKSTNFIRR